MGRKILAVAAFCTTSVTEAIAMETFVEICSLKFALLMIQTVASAAYDSHNGKWWEHLKPGQLLTHPRRKTRDFRSIRKSIPSTYYTMNKIFYQLER